MFCMYYFWIRKHEDLIDIKMDLGYNILDCFLLFYSTAVTE